MERYLFRGLRTNGEGWVYGFVTFRPDGSAYIEGYNGNILRYYGHEVIPETVGQWTGLRDKWEQMIFEGDILSDNIICGFFDGCYRTTYENDIQNGNQLSKKRCKYLEVIGNIHEEASNATL